MLRGLLRWGHVEGYFSAGQVEMMPDKCATVAPAFKSTSAPGRRRKGRGVFEKGEHIRGNEGRKLPEGEKTRETGIPGEPICLATPGCVSRP
jgi:hypothetical protein